MFTGVHEGRWEACALNYGLLGGVQIREDTERDTGVRIGGGSSYHPGATE